MITSRKITADRNYYQVMESLTQTYTEIASTRAQKIRRSVLLNRTFLQEISGIYEQIKTNYHEVFAKMKPSSLGIRKNGRTALVLLTTNSGLYGDLNAKIFNYFNSWVDRYKDGADLFVVGRRGQLLFESRYPGKPYKLLELSDDYFDKNLFQRLTDTLIEFSEVLVFYGQFKSLASQEATMNNLTGSGLTSPSIKESVFYLFEPSLNAILKFFETEIFTSLLLQTIYESQLAKYAARIDSLDKSSEKIRQKIRLLMTATQSLKHQKLNRNQLEISAAQLLWKKL